MFTLNKTDLFNALGLVSLKNIRSLQSRSRGKLFRLRSFAYVHSPTYIASISTLKNVESIPMIPITVYYPEAKALLFERARAILNKDKK